MHKNSSRKLLFCVQDGTVADSVTGSLDNLRRCMSVTQRSREQRTDAMHDNYLTELGNSNERYSPLSTAAPRSNVWMTLRYSRLLN